MSIALETKGLQKQFGGLVVTRDLSLRLEQGARHALIGPNGGGDWWRVMGTRADVNAEIAENLARFHLLDVMNELTATLPYGKQRLLEIAVAIATKPRVLLL